MADAHGKQAEARLTVSRLACDLFWRNGVAATSGDDIAAAAGLSTRTIWRYFRTKESCVEPVLAKTSRRFVRLLQRWPDELSLGEHLAADTLQYPFSPQDLEDEWSALRIATMSATEPALRTAYLMVHDELEHEFIPIIAARLRCGDDDLTVRLYAASVTAALRVVDEYVSKAFIVDKVTITRQEALELIDRAILDATSGRLGGPVTD